MKKKNKILLFFIIFIFSIFFIVSLFLDVYIVKGNSMEPYFHNGDVILGMVLPFIKRGDIIIFKSPEKNSLLVKEVVGVPGDTILFKNGFYYINGIKIPIKISDDVIFKKLKLDRDEYFVLGENVAVSYDSRYFGPISKKNIKAKVLFKIF